MGLQRLCTGPRAVICVLAVVAVVAYYNSLWMPHASGAQMAAERGSQDPIQGLKVSLEQSQGASPPTVVATVTNTNAEPVTVLLYDSPLDRSALQLGLLSITPAGADAPLKLDPMQVRRVWPPKLEHLIAIPPGESASNDIVLTPFVVSPRDLGDKATVALQGKWEVVWAKSKDDISEHSLNDPRGSEDTVSGQFRSNELEIITADQV